MKDADLLCRDDVRRRHLRALTRDGEGQPVPGALSGLDYVEVGDDQTSLTVYFFGAPAKLGPDDFVIEGGRRVRDIAVIEVSAPRHGVDDSSRPTDDNIVLGLSRAGDFSTYTLRISTVGEDGTRQPHPGIDARYASIEFSFKASCPSDLDCKVERVCLPTVPRPTPVFTYLAKDYASFRQLLLDRLATTLPDWRERHVPDEYLSLVELLAYVGDHLSYYQDAVATEAYLGTARQRVSIRRHARLVDYLVHEGCNARAWVVLEVRGIVRLPRDRFRFVTRLPGVKQATLLAEALPLDVDYQTFLPLSFGAIDEVAMEGCGPTPLPAEVIFYEAHNAVGIYTWGGAECCLEAGATRATLLDGWVTPPATTTTPTPNSPPGTTTTPEPTRLPTIDRAPSGVDPRIAAMLAAPAAPADVVRALHLQVGDVIVFEEVRGPKTGVAADADPKRRWAVRLTKVTPTEDPLNPCACGPGLGRPTPLLEVEWMVEDALPFSLCLSALVPPSCSLVQDITVVRANVVLVDHGRWTYRQPLGPTLPEPTPTTCCSEDRPTETFEVSARFRPLLPTGPTVFCQPYPRSALPAASVSASQDPRRSLPRIVVRARPTDAGDVDSDPVEDALDADWTPRLDLLESGPDDRDFVAEVEDDGRARLRFGDGQLGRRPPPGLTFEADVRIGGGARGNVSAGAIAHLVFEETISGVVIDRVWNPMPASGGVDPEPLETARLLASGGGATTLQRAITADDYGRVAEMDPHVQRAAATFRWTGSWYEAFVAIDPLGTDEARPELAEAVARRIEGYRRIGHDVAVAQVEYVPLRLEVHVCARPDYLRAHVAAAVQEALGTGVLADGRKAFFHPDALVPGAPVLASAIIAAVQGIEGVASVELTRFEREFAPSSAALARGALLIAPLEVAQLDADPSAPERGVLVVDVRGGR